MQQSNARIPEHQLSMLHLNMRNGRKLWMNQTSERIRFYVCMGERMKL